MRKILLLAAVLIGLFFVSCSDDSSTDPANIAPSCEITSPADSSTINMGDTLTVNVDADDIDGNIEEVIFYLDDEEIALITDSTYSYDFLTNTMTIGFHALKAIAIDNDGAETIDEIIVDLNNLPVCEIVSHIDGAITDIGRTVTIIAIASDDNKSKSVTSVEFYIDDTLEYVEKIG